MALLDEGRFGMGSGQSKALVIDKRGRQIGACIFLCTLYDGATEELCGRTRSGRENKWPLSILTYFAILLKTPGGRASGTVGVS